MTLYKTYLENIMKGFSPYEDSPISFPSPQLAAQYGFDRVKFESHIGSLWEKAHELYS